MAYDETYPIDSETVGNLPGAIRIKGQNLKTLIDALTGSDIEIDDANVSFTASEIQSAIENLTAEDSSIDDSPLNYTASTVQAYIEALDDVAVVDDNLDVSSPSNGYYVRWDNGLQICFYSITGIDATKPATSGSIYYSYSDELVSWSFPTSFSESPKVLTNQTIKYLIGSLASNSTSGASIGLIAVDGSYTGATVAATAIGRWK